ncbi:MAG: DNA translocase FtsK [Clostridiales bacterium]|nr:DNA translocase FtsK [Clostridiales bacterium]
MKMGEVMAKTNNKPKQARGKAREREPLSTRQKEIISVAVMAAALLLLCCIIMAPEAGDKNALGAVSLLLLQLMRFLAGGAAITLPICLLIYGALLLAGSKRVQGGVRFWGMLMIWAAFLGLFSLPSLTQPPPTFITYMLKAVAGEGGGVVGCLLAYVLHKAFARSGTLIILIALALIGLLIFTDTSLMDILRALKRLFTARYNRARGRMADAAADAPDKRRMPLIITHDDPAPTVSESTEAEKAAAPPLNRFAAEYLPEITVEGKAAKAPRGRKTKTAPAEEKLPQPAREEEKTPPTVIIDGETVAAEYQLPPIELIEHGVKVKNPHLNKAIADSISLLEGSLGNFGVKATVTQVVAGPAVTRYELQPAPGIKVARIVSLSDDIALALAATAVRIEAPIPGKSAIGIEVAREQTDTVYFREVLESAEFSASESKLSFALGKNIGGEAIIGDLAKMPHLLIAGATGSGKSICLNSILCSILYKAKPNEVKLMLIDPKKVELAHYNNLPHLVAPVVTDNKKAANALKWVINEMENRYTLFVGAAVKDFAAYNLAREEEPLPQIVVVIDELADLMMVARHDVEDAICRIAQMARAAGIYLLVATQRPSVDVITGLIKANIPSRIAFAVSSYTDSRTILDMGGAEKLLGRGDMLFSPIGANKPLRVQGSFVQEKEIAKLVQYCTQQAAPRFVDAAVEASTQDMAAERLDDVDELFYEAAAIIISSGQASTSYLQRRLSIGNPRAARLIDMLEAKGVVGGPKGAKPRDILMSMDEFNDIYGDAG